LVGDDRDAREVATETRHVFTPASPQHVHVEIKYSS